MRDLIVAVLMFHGVMFVLCLVWTILKQLYALPAVLFAFYMEFAKECFPAWYGGPHLDPAGHTCGAYFAPVLLLGASLPGVAPSGTGRTSQLARTGQTDQRGGNAGNV